ncbi:MAG: DNA-directed RNA polymerase subunit H [Candidatus Methanosuratus sp.]|nr:DNA-directed RNA polymerase subunit H [Candidatus Methanosuratincola sp.]
MGKFDLLDHELVPQFRIMAKEEIEQLRKSLGVRKEDLPWMLKSDPVSKAIGAKPGDVVEIVRKSPVAGRSVAYRYVVPG